MRTRSISWSLKDALELRAIAKAYGRLPVRRGILSEMYGSKSS